MISNDSRPLSPHLQIYRLPLTAVLSITHRITGAALTIGALLLVYVLAAAASGPGAYETAQGLVSAWYGQVILFLFTLAIYFHLCNGVRHLVWDLGYGFELETVDKSSFATIAAALGLTLITWFVALIG